jgi:hypothetical protein
MMAIAWTVATTRCSAAREAEPVDLFCDAGEASPLSFVAETDNVHAPAGKAFAQPVRQQFRGGVPARKGSPQRWQAQGPVASRARKDPRLGRRRVPLPAGGGSARTPVSRAHPRRPGSGHPSAAGQVRPSDGCSTPQFALLQPLCRYPADPAPNFVTLRTNHPVTRRNKGHHTRRPSGPPRCKCVQCFGLRLVPAR